MKDLRLSGERRRGILRNRDVAANVLKLTNGLFFKPRTPRLIYLPVWWHPFNVPATGKTADAVNLSFFMVSLLIKGNDTQTPYRHLNTWNKLMNHC